MYFTNEELHLPPPPSQNKEPDAINWVTQRTTLLTVTCLRCFGGLQAKALKVFALPPASSPYGHKDFAQPFSIWEGKFCPPPIPFAPLGWGAGQGDALVFEMNILSS